MFARPVSESKLEKLINKATDETLTSDNWQYILDVCDYISSNPEEATKEAIKIITLRLSLKDANVILRTLSLITAIAENCGSRMKQEIATKSFLQDCLLKKLGDRKLHKTVKIKIADIIKQLYESFKTDPSLKPMTDAYNILMKDYKQYNGIGPEKPMKQELSQQDKLKEEEDYQRVLKLSLQEYEREQSVKKAYLNDKPLPETKKNQSQSSQAQLQLQEQPKGDTIATVSKVRALYDLISYEPDELSFRKGDVITVIESVYRDWWRGSLPNGKIGIFPLNYVTPIVNKSPEEINKELQIEDNILNELKKVDKLLALLSNPNANEDEVTQLYNEVLPLRPLLGGFIDKYSGRNEELTTLNNQLSTQVKYYNELMDNLINQRINHQSHSIPNSNSNFNLSQHNAMAPYPNDPIQMQPTSNGFGNQQNPYPQVPQISQQQTNQSLQPQPQPQPHQLPPQASSQNSYQYQYSQYPSDTQLQQQQQQQGVYLNINSFPEVNNMPQ